MARVWVSGIAAAVFLFVFQAGNFVQAQEPAKAPAKQLTKQKPIKLYSTPPAPVIAPMSPPPAYSWDVIEQAIAALRVGPALATADLLIIHPSSWSAIRRQKDQYGHYLVAADPSRDQVD